MWSGERKPGFQWRPKNVGDARAWGTRHGELLTGRSSSQGETETEGETHREDGHTQRYVSVNKAKRSLRSDSSHGDEEFGNCLLLPVLAWSSVSSPGSLSFFGNVYSVPL